MGLATTDLVQSTMLVSENQRTLQLVATTSDDRPLSVQIYGAKLDHLVRAAKWLADRGYEGIDINMGCPMAKVNGAGGGARLMRDSHGACSLVGTIVDSVEIPVTVKMRLGWDRDNITAPALAREFEQLGVAAITLHGRTRQQGFQGNVQLDGITQTVAAVDSIPVIGNGDVRTIDDAVHMRNVTGCDAVAIGRGAMLDPWLFRKISDHQMGRAIRQPSAEESLNFLRRHFQLMCEQHDDYSCILFRKFAAWYGAVMRIPEDLENRLRRFESTDEFNQIIDLIADRYGERVSPVPTALVKVPNGPVERW